MIRAAIVQHSIDVNELIVEVSNGGNGAIAIFLGTVRSSNEGREVTGIEYSAYNEMAASEIETILAESRERFGFESAVVEHRIGRLGIGDASIAVIVASPHRAAAMDALRFIVDETKGRAPIWKLEHYADGSREWVNAMTGTG